jgi:TPR repeat protein
VPRRSRDLRRLGARLVLIAAIALLGIYAPPPAVAEEVAALLRRAESGDARAAFVLGMRYAQPDSASRDDAEAARWLRQAAEQGLAEAQYNLGIMYGSGRGVTRDAERAVHWYTLAAEQGLAGAQYNLGSMYAVGDGAPRNESTAAEWFRRAALQDVPEAAYNLGVLYDLGRGVPADAATAMKWYERAAERGYHPAASRLAALRAANPRLVAASSSTANTGVPPAESPAPASDPDPAPVPSPIPDPAPAPAAAPESTASAAPEQASGPGTSSASPWLAGLDAGHYTLQVLSHTDENAVRHFLRENFDDGQAGYFAFELDGETWFSVVTGEYPSYSQATAAGEILAGRIRGLQPWVRKIAIIQKKAIR